MNGTLICSTGVTAALSTAPWDDATINTSAAHRANILQSTILPPGMEFGNGTFSGTEHKQEGMCYDFISEQFYETFEYICNVIITPILCILGLVTNILGVGVLWHDTKQQKMSIYYYLCALTLSDIFYLALGLIRIIPEIIKKFDIDRAKYIAAETKPGVIYLDILFSHNSAAMIIVMSVERLLALLRPFTVKHTWFAKYPIGIILFCFVFNVVFLLPYPVCIEVVSFQRGNETEYLLSYRNDAKDFMKLYVLVQAIACEFLPVMCLLVTNIAIPIKYYHLTKSRLATLTLVYGNVSGKQTKITLTVIVITATYLLLTTPLAVSKILPLIDPEYSFNGAKKTTFWFLMDLTNAFTYINAANDFLIYILISNHYRTIFQMMYCRSCVKGSTSSNVDAELIFSASSNKL